MEPSAFDQIEVVFPGRLFCVSRPGRGADNPDARVTEQTVESWIEKIARVLRSIDPECLGHPVHYICLLGSKTDGRREISDFYPARGPEDPPGKPTFEEYLNGVANGNMSIRVHHISTVDHKPVPAQTIAKIEPLMRNLLESGAIVLIGCSAAVGRTRQVLEAMPWIKKAG